MPLTVRNHESNPTVFAKTIDGNQHRITWAAAGDDDGDDVRTVHLSLAEDPDFLDNVAMGVFSIESGPAEVVEQIQQGSEQKRQRRADRAGKQHVALDRRQDRDYVSHTCPAPSGQGRTTECGTTVIQTARAAKEHPPLCPTHAHLSDRFSLIESGSKGEGATESKDGVVTRQWAMVQLTPSRS